MPKHKLATKKIVEKLISEYELEELGLYSEIEDEAVEYLVYEDPWRDGIDGNLNLSGLKCISDFAIEMLSNWSGSELAIGGIGELTVDKAKLLAKFSFDDPTLKDAGITADTGEYFLGDITNTSSEALKELVKWRGNKLGLNGKGILSKEHAKVLATWAPDITQPDLTILTEDALTAGAAKEMSKWKGGILTFGELSDLPVEAANELAKWSGDELHFLYGKVITGPAAEALAKWEGDGLYIGGVTNLSKPVASAFANWKGFHFALTETGKITDVTAGILSKYLCSQIAFSMEGVKISKAGLKLLSAYHGNFLNLPREQDNEIKQSKPSSLNPKITHVRSYMNPGWIDCFDHLALDKKGNQVKLSESDILHIEKILSVNECDMMLEEEGVGGLFQWEVKEGNATWHESAGPDAIFQDFLWKCEWEKCDTMVCKIKHDEEVVQVTGLKGTALKLKDGFARSLELLLALEGYGIQDWEDDEDFDFPEEHLEADSSEDEELQNYKRVVEMIREGCQFKIDIKKHKMTFKTKDEELILVVPKAGTTDIKLD